MKFTKCKLVEANTLLPLICTIGASTVLADVIPEIPVVPDVKEELVQEVAPIVEDIVEAEVEQVPEKKKEIEDLVEKAEDDFSILNLSNLSAVDEARLLPDITSGEVLPDTGSQLPEVRDDLIPQTNQPVREALKKPTKKTVLTFVENLETLQYEEANLLGVKVIRDKRKKLEKKADYIVRVPDKDQVGVEFYGLPYMPEPQLLKKELEGYLDKPLTYEGLEEIVKKIQDHYISQGHPLIHVYVPVQQVAQSVEIAVLEGAITQVVVKDQEQERNGFFDHWKGWYSQAYDMDALAEKVIKRSKVLPYMQPKDAVAILDEAVENPWERLNRKQSHPFLKATGSLSPAKEEEEFLLGETRLTISHEQKRPLKFFLGYDNTLTEAIGGDRIYTGVIWYDAFNLGLNHQFATQFFASADPDSFNGFASSYLIPWENPIFFPNGYEDKHFTELYASYVSTNAEAIAAGVPTNFGGESIVVGGIHYMSLPDIVKGGAIIPRPASEPDGSDGLKIYSKRNKSRQALGVYHEVGVGLEFKQTNNTLEFGGVSVSDDDTLISNFLTVYNLRQTDKTGESNLTWRNVLGIGGSSAEELEVLRAGADPNYYYTTLSLSREQDLIHGAYANIKFTGQFSTANLLSSEQLGLGGNNSIRGYSERAYRADTGFFVSLELVSPPLHPLMKWTGNVAWADELRFLAFFDYGAGRAADEETFTDIPQALTSVGAGLRYQLGNGLNVRLDYGFPLQDLDSPEFAEELSDPRVHIGVVWTF